MKQSDKKKVSKVEEAKSGRRQPRPTVYVPENSSRKSQREHTPKFAWSPRECIGIT